MFGNMKLCLSEHLHFFLKNTYYILPPQPTPKANIKREAYKFDTIWSSTKHNAFLHRKTNEWYPGGLQISLHIDLQDF